MITVCIIISLFIALNLSSFLLSKIEKLYVKKNHEIGHIFCPQSLVRFKKTRLLLFMFASVETVFNSNKDCYFVLAGVFLIIIGMVLRIAAIKSLGELWSYHIIIYKKHQKVKTGIYRYLRHPAYIGNIHIVGLILAAGSQKTAMITVVYICHFYFCRTRIEDRLLAYLE